MWTIAKLNTKNPEGQADGSLQLSEIIIINGGKWDTQVKNYHFPQET